MIREDRSITNKGVRMRLEDFMNVEIEAVECKIERRTRKDWLLVKHNGELVSVFLSFRIKIPNHEEITTSYYCRDNLYHYYSGNIKRDTDFISLIIKCIGGNFSSFTDYFDAEEEAKFDVFCTKITQRINEIVQENLAKYKPKIRNEPSGKNDKKLVEKTKKEILEILGSYKEVIEPEDAKVILKYAHIARDLCFWTDKHPVAKEILNDEFLEGMAKLDSVAKIMKA